MNLCLHKLYAFYNHNKNLLAQINHENFVFCGKGTILETKFTSLALELYTFFQGVPCAVCT